MLYELFKLSFFQKLFLLIITFVALTFLAILVVFVLVLLQLASIHELVQFTTRIVPLIIGILLVSIYLSVIIYNIIYLIIDTVNLKKQYKDKQKYHWTLNDLLRIFAIFIIVISFSIGSYHLSIESKLHYHNLIGDYKIHQARVIKCEDISTDKKKNYEIEIAIPTLTIRQVYMGKEIQKLFNILKNKKTSFIKLIRLNENKYIYSIGNYLLYENYNNSLLKVFLPFSWVYLILILIMYFFIALIVFILRVFVLKIPLDVLVEGKYF